MSRHLLFDRKQLVTIFAKIEARYNIRQQKQLPLLVLGPWVDVVGVGTRRRRRIIVYRLVCYLLLGKTKRNQRKDQPGTDLSRLNARQSEIFKGFCQKGLFKRSGSIKRSGRIFKRFRKVFWFRS